MNKDGSARILIVDDEPFNVDYIQQELDDLGYETSTATNGTEALESIAADPPDLVLLDVMMPDIDGITVCRMLKDDPKTRLIPVVIMTALNAQEDRIRGIEAGADDFLSKPVDDRELIARIGTLLKQKKTVDRAIGELESASDQLERLGSRELDASVLVLKLSGDATPAQASDEALGFILRRYARAIAELVAEAGGESVEADEETQIVLFRNEVPTKHARTAVAVAQKILDQTKTLNAENTLSPITADIAVSSGSIQVESTRMEDEAEARWRLSLTGGPVDTATELVNAAMGSLVVGPETANRIADHYGLERLTDSAYRVLGTREPTKASQPAPQPASEQPATMVTSPDAWWPAAFAALESEVRNSWEVEGEIFLTRILSGKSGALVYAVDLNCRDFTGQAILKLAESKDAGWGEEEESARHRQATEANRAYATEHLPQVVHTAQLDRQLAILVTIAARGLEYSAPWAESPYERQLASVERLSPELLGAWNSDYKLANTMNQPSSLLQSWLDYRLDPTEGRIHAFLRETYGLTAEDESFIFDGHWYPNPLAFALDRAALPDRLRLRAVTGRMHGDLHGFNVLVRSQTPDEIDYYLIDLAMYQDDAFLLYDHAYFEIAHLIHARGDVDPERWLNILAAMSRSETPGADDLGLAQLIAKLRQGVLDWIDTYEANRLSYLESQYALGRVAAGLNFVHKALPPEQRLLALLYSATALKGYLKFHNVDWPKHGNVLKHS